jgi:HrpA-like RNA helicase
VYHATENHEEDRVDAALKQCFQLHFNKPPGDILVFMPGMSLCVASQLDSNKLLVLGQEEIEGLVKSLEQYSKEIPEDMLQVCLRST